MADRTIEPDIRPNGAVVIDDSDQPATVTPTPPRARSRQGSIWLVVGERYGLVVVTVAAIVLFTILKPSLFMTVDNWQQIGSTQSVTVVLALAFMLPLVGGDFDVSIGANAIICSVACGSATADHGWPLGAAIPLALLIGLVIGVFNGILVTRARLNGLIATLGTATVLQGLVVWYSGGVPISEGISPTLLNLGTRTWIGIPRLAIIAVIAAIVVAYLLTQTPYGRRLTSVGSNRSSARLVGVRVTEVTMLSFGMAGVMAGLAGIMIVAQQGSANPSVDGVTTLLPALTVVFLGASAFRPGEFNVPGMIVALLLIAVLVSGLTLSGVASWVSPVCNGFALIVGVGLSAYFRAQRLGSAGS